MSIERVEIENFMGIETLEADVGEGGVIATGETATGKSSFVEAVLATLQGRGVDADAIRVSDGQRAKAAVVRVHMAGGIEVRRRISESGTTVAVTTPDGKKDAEWLRRLMGPLVDPVALFSCKPERRREIILDALRPTVTAEQIERWAPGAMASCRPDLSRNGLVVVKEVRKIFYDARTSANAARDRDAQSLAQQHAALMDAPADAPTTADAGTRRERAVQARAALEAREAEYLRAAERFSSASKKIDALVKEANDVREQAPFGPSPSAIEDAQKKYGCLNERRLAVTEELTVLVRQTDQAHRDVNRLIDEREHRAAAIARAVALDQQAEHLEKTLADARPTPPRVEDKVAAEEELRRADKAVSDAAAAATRRAQIERIEKVRADAKVSEKRAAELDEAVKRLTDDAPRELLASCGSPGLTVTDDDVLLDGVSLGKLSGGERLFFAIDIAAKVNGPARVLFCEELEKIQPPAMLEEFVKRATAGGRCLIGSRTAEGRFRLEAIRMKCCPSPTGPSAFPGCSSGAGGQQ